MRAGEGVSRSRAGGGTGREGGGEGRAGRNSAVQEAPPAEWEESARAPFLAHFFFASFDDRGVGGVLLGRLSRRVAASLKGGTRKGAVQLALPSSGTCVRVPSLAWWFSCEKHRRIRPHMLLA